MGSAAALATYFVAFMVASEVVGSLRRRGRGILQTLALYRGIRTRHVLQGLAALVATVVAAALLAAVLHPFPAATTGWWQLLGGNGNVLFASSTATGTEATGLLRFLALVIPFALLLIIPRLVRLEEQIFRRGRQRQPLRRQLQAQLLFGLAHMLLGVPLFIGLALAVTGGAYLAVYTRHLSRSGSQGLAVLHVTRVHAAANVVVVSLVIAGLVLGTGGS